MKKNKGARVTYLMQCMKAVSTKGFILIRVAFMASGILNFLSFFPPFLPQANTLFIHTFPNVVSASKGERSDFV